MGDDFCQCMLQLHAFCQPAAAPKRYEENAKRTAGHENSSNQRRKVSLHGKIQADDIINN